MDPDGTYGTDFCKAIGMKSGSVTDTQPSTAEQPNLAQFDSRGHLIAVETSLGSIGIKTVTCQK